MVEKQIVTVDNCVRAETDLTFKRYVAGFINRGRRFSTVRGRFR